MSWRTCAFLYLGVGLVAFIGGLVVGHWNVPAKVVTVDSVVTQEDTEAREQVRRLTEELEHVKRDTHRVVVAVQKPDGTKTTTTTEDTHTDRTDTKRTDTKTDSDTKVATKTETDHKQTVTNAPQWKVSGFVGLGLSDLSRPVYGAAVERRILGPVSAGVWALSSGVGGVMLSVEF